MSDRRTWGAYFGEPWLSGVCDDGHRIVTPLAEPCAYCVEPIGEADQGSFVGGLNGQLEPVHKECSLRMVLGGIGHLEDHAYWCAHNHDPDGGRSYRQSALEVWDRWLSEGSRHG